jgi:hypothetical protein
MDTSELRWLFVAGLVVLGGFAILVGSAVSWVAERWRSRREVAAPATAQRGDTRAKRAA